MNWTKSFNQNVTIIFLKYKSLLNSNAHAKFHTWIFEIQLSDNKSEFEIIENDFYSCTIWVAVLMTVWLCMANASPVYAGVTKYISLLGLQCQGSNPGLHKKSDGQKLCGVLFEFEILKGHKFFIYIRLSIEYDIIYIQFIL